MIKKVLFTALLLFSEACGAAMIDAAREISSFILAIKAVTVILGIYATGWSIMKLANTDFMSTSKGGMGDRSPGAYLAGVGLGILMISFSMTISLTSNSLMPSNDRSNQLRTAITADYVANPEALEQFISSGEYTTSIARNGIVPLNVVKVALMMCVLGGVWAIAAALRIAWVALTAGSEMGGSSLMHRAGDVFWRTVGGIMLINIETTLSWTSNSAIKIISAVAN